MEKSNFIELPVISDLPYGAEYFWFQLPYAVPGFFSFFVAVILSIICIQAFISRRLQKEYLIFALVFLSYGILALILGFRATIQSKEILINIHDYLYWFVLILYPVSFYAFDFIMNGKLRSIKYLFLPSIIITVICIIYLFLGRGFTGNWLEYPFGIYPEGGIVLKLWGGLGVFSIIYGLVMSGVYIKKHSFLNINKHLYFGMLGIFLLLASNFPSLAGYSIYPLGMFFFIPMTIVGFGLFKDEFLDLRSLVLEKKLGFYSVAFTVVIILFFLSYFLSSNMKPGEDNVYYNPYLIIPLISLILLFGLSAYLAGINPSNQLNIYIAGLLLTTGILQIVAIFRSIQYDLIVLYRIEQLLYFIFVFLPSLNTRFMFSIFKRDFNYKVYTVDFFCIIASFLTQTPFLFDGFYEYSFGRMPKSGFVLNMFVISGVISLAFILSEWRKIPRQEKTKFQRDTFQSITLSNFLILLNIPAILGYPIYPLGNLQFIPVILIGYFFLKEQSFSVKGDAYLISSRYTVFVFFLTVLLVSFYWISYPVITNTPQKFLHSLVLWGFFFLASYISLFVVIRPIAGLLDKNFHELRNTTLELDRSRIRKEQSLKELEKLNQLQRKINSTLELESIIMELSEFFRELYSIKDTWVLLVDDKKNEIYTGGVNIFDISIRNKENIEWSWNFRAPINKDIGTLYRAYKSEKFIYSPEKLLNRATNSLDREIIERQDLKSVLHYPIRAEDKTIGIFCINLDPNNIPTKEEMQRMESFILVLAGSIQRSVLFQESFQERQNALDLAGEIKSVNNLNRFIIENENIEEVMNLVIGYLNDSLGLNAYYSLYRYEPSTHALSLLSCNPPEHITKLEFKKIISAKMDLDDNNPFHKKCITSKRVLYYSKIKNRKDHIGFESWVINVCNFKNFLMIPLLIDNKPIGVLNLSDKAGDTWKIDHELKSKLSRLGTQISSAIDRFIQYNDLKTAQKENEMLVDTLSILNKISYEFNHEIQFQSVMDKLENYLVERFGIPQYGVAIVSKDKKSAGFIYSNLYKHMSDSKKKVVDNCNIDLTDNLAGHSIAYKRKKSFFLPNIKEHRTAESEKEIIRELKIRTLLIIPLVVKNEVIGFLDFYYKDSFILPKKKREFLVEFSNLIASALWNALSLEDLRRAYEDLKASQNQLIQSEKLASLGQLVSGVAHEINSPLAAIKSSIGNLESNFEKIVSDLPEFFQYFENTEWRILRSLLSRRVSGNLSTKQERELKKKWISQLQEKQISDPEEIADVFVELGLDSLDSQEWNLFQNDHISIVLTLLTNLSGFLQSTGTIQDSVHKATKIIKALKSYANTDNSEEKQKVNIIDGLETVLLIYQNYIKKGVEVERDYKDIPFFYCIPDEMNQVWTNLIYNAMQAMDFQGRIQIKVYYESINDEIAVKVEDNGPGIPQEIQEKIFQAFYTTKPRGEGSGLGLHITKKILDKHHARVILESEPGRTLFKVLLPVAKNENIKLSIREDNDGLG